MPGWVGTILGQVGDAITRGLAFMGLWSPMGDLSSGAVPKAWSQQEEIPSLVSWERLSQGEEDQRDWEEVGPGSPQEEEQGQAEVVLSAVDLLFIHALHIACCLSHHQTECLRHRQRAMGELGMEGVTVKPSMLFCRPLLPGSRIPVFSVLFLRRDLELPETQRNVLLLCPFDDAASPCKLDLNNSSFCVVMYLKSSIIKKKKKKTQP